MDEDENTMEVIVPDDQLSLAIGKKGQNVRLASRLANWKLDVRSESEVELEHVQVLEALNAIPGIGESNADLTAELLYQQGFKSAQDIAGADAEALLDIEGIGPDRAPAIWAAAKAHAEQIAAEQAAAEQAAAEQAAAEQAAAEQAAAEQAAAEQAAAEQAAELGEQSVAAVDTPAASMQEESAEAPVGGGDRAETAGRTTEDV